MVLEMGSNTLNKFVVCREKKWKSKGINYGTVPVHHKVEDYSIY